MTRQIEQTTETLWFLMSSFRDVLHDVGSSDVAAHLPWQARWANEPTTPAAKEAFPSELAEANVQAYSIAFQLLDEAEENAVAQGRRAVERSGHLENDAGSWDQLIGRLREQGVTAEQLAELIPRVRVEPVFTAHPTEAKRQTVLEHHRRLYRLLVQLENTMWTPAERQGLEGEVRASLERLWRTGEIYLEKPSLADERRGVLHYLRHVFPAVLPWFTARLRAAWSRAGLDPSALDLPEQLPRVSFGNWVGGDRDGHPGVTADITTETLALFAATALDIVDDALTELAVALSLSERRQPIPAVLTARIDSLAEVLGDAGQAARARNPGEPWRQYVNLMRAALPRGETPSAGCYRSPDELLNDLTILRDALRAVGAHRIARADVDPVAVLVSTFGFHLAAVDVRQNSAFHDRALAQLLAVAGVDKAADYATWDLTQRRALLEAELGNSRPFSSPEAVEGTEARAVLEVYRRLARHGRRHGWAGLGALIVSMTRSVEDLLAVYVLARDGGLLIDGPDGRGCPLEVVPLFETIDDLERAPDILDAYLAHPIVRTSLERRRVADGADELVQQVMIGYSDSSKDGGIVCSLWSLYRGQRRLAEVGRRHGVRVRFFHGRGGTIGRGAGPTHRFVKALPPRSVGGDLRLTEQGETIDQKYANRITAAHHLELLAAGTLYATASDAIGRDDPPELLELMDRLAMQSRRAYRGLLEMDGFVQFFEQATPLDAIETSRIGSRPARRTGKRTLGDLRAIPWVFAWNQSRFILPGWFGVGSALSTLRDDAPEAFQLVIDAKSEQTRWAPMHYLISNAATAWMTSDVPVMMKYAELVEDAEVRSGVLQRIQDEHRRTGEALAAIYGGPLSHTRPEIWAMLQLRHEALVPLHLHQIELLRRWRARESDEQPSSGLLPQLLLTVNAIASGLGATG